MVCAGKLITPFKGWRGLVLLRYIDIPSLFHIELYVFLVFNFFFFAVILSLTLIQTCTEMATINNGMEGLLITIDESIQLQPAGAYLYGQPCGLQRHHMADQRRQWHKWS
jgi:hypothetical protein